MHRTAPAARHATVRSQVAVAPCFFQLPASPDEGLVEIQATPAGAFRPRDGRKLPVDAWHMDAQIAARVIDRFRAHKTPLVIDYEHQTMLAEENGQPAPAAGFVRDMEWREGSGLWLKVELTPRARRYIAKGEYRYFSPVFRFDERTGVVLELLMGALTNNPALDGMAPLELRAAARFHLHEDPSMNKLLLAVCTALAIPFQDRDEAEVEAAALSALETLKGRPDPLVALRQQLKLSEDAGVEAVVAACKALQDQAQPDPAKFVGVEVVEDLRRQIATLSASHAARELDELIKPALEDGRLLPAQEKWARELGAKDVASLRAYLQAAQPIAALRSSQTRGMEPGGRDEHGLTLEELAVCRATGVAPAEFAKHKPKT